MREGAAAPSTWTSNGNSAVISSFLMHVRVEKGLSANTISAYKRDLNKFESSPETQADVEGVAAMTSDFLA